jgi:hypothetical protein
MDEHHKAKLAAYPDCKIINAITDLVESEDLLPFIQAFGDKVHAVDKESNVLSR